jgi:hypothetical protein
MACISGIRRPDNVEIRVRDECREEAHRVSIPYSRITFIVSTMLAAGCSAPSSAIASYIGGGTGGGDAASGGTGGGDAASGGTGGTEIPVAPPGPLARPSTGFVEATSGIEAGYGDGCGGPLAAVNAVFYDEAAFLQANCAAIHASADACRANAFLSGGQYRLAACLVEEGGGCTGVFCSEPTEDSTKYVEGAGTLSLTAGVLSCPFVPLGGGYACILIESALWTTGGTPVSLSASGGDVPAFSMQLISSPTVQVTSWAPGTQSLTISEAGFSLDWTPGAPGSLFDVSLQDATGHTSVDCRWPIEQGHGTVPVALLNMIRKGPNGSISWSGLATKTQLVGDFAITLNVTTINGESLLVTFQ